METRQKTKEKNIQLVEERLERNEYLD
jgi:hypothetical protein